MDGFSGTKLLPTDRPPFSSADGLQKKDKESIRLPSMAWEWESNWYLETTFNRERLANDGWTYAVDFPAEYYSKKSFTSCVRRRKWIRYRRYIANNSWSMVSPIHKDPAEDPFIDVSIGGHELPNGNPEELLVWAVTISGKVFVRQGVTTTCPEGSGWLPIPIPEKCEVNQISVGPTGLVWAITWHGKSLVRSGVTRLEPTGTSWCVVDAPTGNTLTHVSVGENVVWALTRDNRVWFRNGIRGIGAGDSDSLAKGIKWVEMVGRMHMISIGPRDQVMGILASREGIETEVSISENRNLVLRTDVSSSDASGKTWKRITAPVLESMSSDTPISKRIRTKSHVSTKSYASSNSERSRDNDYGGIRQPDIATNTIQNVEIEPVQPIRSIEHGSSNDNFKKKVNKAGDMVAKQVVLNAATAVAGATVGRIPVIGGPLTMVAREMAREEIQEVSLLEKVKPQEQSNRSENEKTPTGNVESSSTSMYVSAMESPLSKTKEKHSESLKPQGIPHEGANLKHVERDCSELSLESSDTEVNDNVYDDLKLDLIDREDFYGDYYTGTYGQKGSSSNNQWVWIAAGSCCIDSGVGNMISLGSAGTIVGPAHWFVENSNDGSMPTGRSSVARETWQENILNVS